MLIHTPTGEEPLQRAVSERMAAGRQSRPQLLRRDVRRLGKQFEH